MGLREVMNAKPQATKAFIGLIVLVAVASIAVQVLGNRRGITTKLPDVYFTDDDGKTFFAASAKNVPPWDHDGKQAVAAHVYRADGQNFVAYLSRFTPEARERIMKTGTVTAADEKWGRELKRPGDTTWVKGSDQKRVAQIAEVRGPKGQTDVEPVEPDA